MIDDFTRGLELLRDALPLLGATPDAQAAALMLAAGTLIGLDPAELQRRPEPEQPAPLPVARQRRRPYIACPRIGRA